MRFGLPVLAFGLILASCKSNPSASDVKSDDVPSASSSLGLGLNDLSILMPRLAAKDVDSKLPFIIDKNGDEGFVPAELVKATIDKQIDQNKGPTGRMVLNDKDFGSFKLTAIRFVPCANELQTAGDSTKCVRTLQIIWQPTSGLILDRGIHTIYVLNRDEFQSVVNALKELHAKAPLDTEKMPLLIQPVIAKEGDGPYFQGIMGLVAKHAKASRLIGFASLQSDQFEAWSMAQFAFVDGKVVPLPVATLPDNTLEQSFSDIAASNHDFEGIPKTTGDVSIPFLQRKFRGPPMPKEQSDRIQALRLKNAFIIDNPMSHDIKNMDCAGCHLSFHTIQERPDDFKIPETAYSSKHWDLSVTSRTDISNTSLQMFSYFSGDAKITQRVINETAVALDSLVTMGYLPAPAGWEAAVPAVIGEPSK